MLFAPMNGDEFLRALKDAKRRGTEPAEVSAASWTHYMTGRLLDLAKENELHLCGKTLGHFGPDLKTEHLAREYLFDFTLYERDAWKNHSLPCVIIEHENQWSEGEFLRDLWKVMIGFAPLRVMFGYARDEQGVKALATAVRREAASWSYPAQGVEDLVLLRHPGATAWRLLRRPPGAKAWSESVTPDSP